MPPGHSKDSFEIADSVGISGNRRKIKFRQLYEHYEVFDAIVSVTEDLSTRKVRADPDQLLGKVLQGVAEDLAGRDQLLVNCDEAANIARLRIHGDRTLYELLRQSAKAIIYLNGNEGVGFGGGSSKDEEEEKAILACYFSYTIRKLDGLERHCGFIDGTNLQLIRHWPCLTSAGYRLVSGLGGNQKTGPRNYGAGILPRLNVSVIDGRCTLRKDDLTTVNLRQHFSYSSVSSVLYSYQFGCCSGSRLDAANGAFSPTNDLYYYSSKTVDMFREWFSLRLLKKDVIVFSHYQTHLANAVWDGMAAYFGDGDYRFYPFTVPDIVAHELAHGFTEERSNLVYSEQSGGINEAFSDITGEALEYYVFGHTDWLSGGEVSKIGDGMRYFDDPTKDGSSIGHANDFVFGMDVHASSGVFNRVFYILANKKGWTVRKAFEIFLRANQLYWTPLTWFHDASCGVMQAARDSLYNVADVVSAFRNAGVVCPRFTGCTSGDIKKTERHALDHTLTLFWQTRLITVTPCMYNLDVKLSSSSPLNENSDADLYLKRDIWATTFSYDYKSAGPGMQERIRTAQPGAGAWWIMVYAHRTFHSAILTITYNLW